MQEDRPRQTDRDHEGPASSIHRCSLAPVVESVAAVPASVAMIETGVDAGPAGAAARALTPLS